MNADSPATPLLERPPSYRWLQLFMGIICMAMIANLQYGWTLFVNPIDDKSRGRAAIQVAFSIFVVVETWLVPFEGYLVDQFGPQVGRRGRGFSAAAAGSSTRTGQLASDALRRRGGQRHRRRRGVRDLCRQRAQVVPGSARSRRRTHRDGVRRRLGAHRVSHPGDDQGEGTRRRSCSSASRRASS